MADAEINNRRLLRNRFEAYLTSCDLSASGDLDGSPLTLLDLCETLKHDPEPFPRYYDRDLAQLCGHEARVWFRDERSYGDVAWLTAKHVSLSKERKLHLAGVWVATVLKQSGSSNDASAAGWWSGDNENHEIKLDYVERQDEHEPLI